MPDSQSYAFKIKTKSGSIMSNIVKQGTSVPDAERKVKQQFPGCEILDVQIK